MNNVLAFHSSDWNRVGEVRAERETGEGRSTNDALAAWRLSRRDPRSTLHLSESKSSYRTTPSLNLRAPRRGY
ncbi:4644_t:CDS:2 [Acaulospora colombiana]|uniref:4644_t:CDS:1 n=1 Tax=Acaulospora colombiana TaxID=27376 RepID=A0ACA9PMG0_9GLOM|nr:4644_t:CDS:2 [Acaulospora colombiana]